MWFPPGLKEGTFMIKDTQVRKLRQILGEGHPLYRAALKVGMDTKSARKYRHADRLPSESFTPRTWRTPEDPFPDVWPQLRDMLDLNPGLQAKTLFEDLKRRFPGQFPDSQLRTLQRKIKAWKATVGPPKGPGVPGTPYPIDGRVLRDTMGSAVTMPKVLTASRGPQMALVSARSARPSAPLHQAPPRFRISIVARKNGYV
jgi:hypothetical protein